MVPVMAAKFRLARWVPVLCWMTVIFLASTDALSAAHTGGFITPLLLRLFPHISPRALDWIHLGIRKSAHLVEYGILGLLLWRAIPEHRTSPEVTDWWRAGVALLVATFYGATDEFHQCFVPSRGPSVHDVMIDSCGAAIALTLICLATRQRPRRNPDAAAPSPAG
jgi:VanZ family protein